jgi:hypothetical protein
MAGEFRIRERVSLAKFHEIVETHPKARQVREGLMKTGVDDARAKIFAERLVERVVDLFGGWYLDEMNARVKRISDLTDRVGRVYELVTSGTWRPSESQAAELRRLFAELEKEMAALASPSASLRYHPPVLSDEAVGEIVGDILREARGPGARGGAAPPAESPPTAPSSGARVLDPKRLHEAAEKVERVDKDIALQYEEIKTTQETVTALQRQLKELGRNRPTRPTELDKEFLRLFAIEDRQERLDELGQLRVESDDLSPAAAKYLAWLEQFWTAQAKIEALVGATIARGRELEHLETGVREVAEAEHRAASKAVKAFLRTVGPNYGKRSGVPYDEILGKERWDSFLAGRRPEDRPTYARLATDHIVALARIARLPELAEFIEVYGKVSDSAKASMVDELVALGDMEANLLRISAKANGAKSDRSWHGISYDEAREFGYTRADVDAYRIEEDKILEELRRRIPELTNRYKP